MAASGGVGLGVAGVGAGAGASGGGGAGGGVGGQLSMAPVEQQPQPPGHGHTFAKKTFHKPTYCHGCTDMLWGIIQQGHICEGELLFFLNIKKKFKNFWTQFFWKIHTREE